MKFVNKKLFHFPHKFAHEPVFHPNAEKLVLEQVGDPVTNIIFIDIANYACPPNRKIDKRSDSFFDYAGP